MSNKKMEIVKAADDLFYRKGFEATSFSDIAGEVGISRGNFYYHFKTKDEILEAVIELRLENTQAMLDRWQIDGSSPAERIKSFISILIVNWSKIQLYGCPVGTLTNELAKLDHNSRENSVRIFTLFRDWLNRQFVELGCKKKSDEFSLYILSQSQGIATIANAFQDEAFVNLQVQQMCEWVDARMDEDSK